MFCSAEQNGNNYKKRMHAALHPFLLPRMSSAEGRHLFVFIFRLTLTPRSLWQPVFALRALPGHIHYTDVAWVTCHA